MPKPTSDQPADQTQPKRSIFANPIVINSAVIVIALAIAGGLLYYISSSTRVGIEDSMVSAPEISLSASAPGTLDQIYVQEGQQVPVNTVVAKIGDTLVKTTVAGTIVSVQNQIGTAFNAGQPVVTMIDPTQLRIVGTIDENKGLSKIAVGQPATFTVDAYGSKKYQGIVDEISPTANQTGVTFNISDQRPTQQFNIKVRFNPNQYPELRNGMSAKLTVFTK